jgi:hypothetical protein
MTFHVLLSPRSTECNVKDDTLLTGLVDATPEILLGDVMIHTSHVLPSNGEIVYIQANLT